MNTNSNSGTVAEKISSALKKAQIEIEEYALQFALGKADASDKFEELKKDFHQRTHEWKQDFSEFKSANQERAEILKSKLEELQVQLALGKAEAKDLFAGQKKKILDTLHHIESELKSNPEVQSRITDIKNEIRKFKIKLEILELQFELKTFKGTEKFKDAMAKVRVGTEQLFEKIKEKWNDTTNPSSDFTQEITKSFEHLKKAIKSL